MKKLAMPWLLAGLLAAGASGQQNQNATPLELLPPVSATLVEALEPTALREQAREALDRSPAVARATHGAAAALSRAPQARSLPDPMLALTYFALPPETRVGPQRFRAGFSQKLPWVGKRDLAEKTAFFQAAAAHAAVETFRLDVLTEIRRLFHELSFVSEREKIIHLERETLLRFEEAARARYASGRGHQQEVLRIQAQITRVDEKLLKLTQRRVALEAAFNALRDRPSQTPVVGLEMSAPGSRLLEQDGPLEQDGLLKTARIHRPEVREAEAEIAKNRSLVLLAEKGFRPDITVGAGYTVVGKREDTSGQQMPSPDNGQDILGLSASLNLPVWHQRLKGALEEALMHESAAREEKRQVLAGIEATVGDLAARLPLLHDQWALLKSTLEVQAAESLRSAESAYVTGHLNAVDLLDAEVMLFEVRTAAARASADHAIAKAQLERAIAVPLALRQEENNNDE